MTETEVVWPCKNNGCKKNSFSGVLHWCKWMSVQERIWYIVKWGSMHVMRMFTWVSVCANRPKGQSWIQRNERVKQYVRVVLACKSIKRDILWLSVKTKRVSMFVRWELVKISVSREDTLADFRYRGKWVLKLMDYRIYHVEVNVEVNTM